MYEPVRLEADLARSLASCCRVGARGAINRLNGHPTSTACLSEDQHPCMNVVHRSLALSTPRIISTVARPSISKHQHIRTVFASAARMSSWTRLIRFVDTDGQERLGQPVDADLDVGKATSSGKTVEANIIEGSIFDGKVTEEKATVKKVSLLDSAESRGWLTQMSLVTFTGLETRVLYYSLSWAELQRLVRHSRSAPCLPSHAEHAAEAGLAEPAAPVLFIKPRTALAGPGDLSIAKAAQNDQLDFETELACVFSRDCKDVSEADALDYVLGYDVTCYRMLLPLIPSSHSFTGSNDVSVRKIQFQTSQWSFSKGFDDACPVGPCLVRTSSLDPDNLDFSGTLSGEVVQKSNTK